MAELALEMIEAVRTFQYSDEQPLQMRIGINAGPAVAGGIGVEILFYDPWDVTQVTWEKLKDDHVLEPRGTVETRGKGALATRLLEGRKRGGDRVTGSFEKTGSARSGSTRVRMERINNGET